MHRAIPSASKILTRKWIQKDKKIHTQNLKNIKYSLDSSCPPSRTHLKQKSKRLKLIQGNIHPDRNTQIQRENKILIDKISQIFSKELTKCKTMNKKSLNQSSRKKQLRQITQQNQAILKRLQQKRPVYKVFQWQNDMKKHKKLLNHMCEYPYQLGISQQKLTKSYSKRRKSNIKINSRLGSRDSFKPRKLSPINCYFKPPTFKKGLFINGKYYKVEIHRKKSRLTLVCSNIQNPDTFSLNLSWKEAQNIMGGQQDYQTLLSHLQFDKDILSLQIRPDSPPLQSTPNFKMSQELNQQ